MSESTGPSTGSVAVPGRAPAGSSADARWELLEILSVVILAAESLRIVGSIVAGTVYGLSRPVGLLGQQRLIGNAMAAAANFSDGPGIVLLLLSLALLWWRVEYWTQRVRRSVGERGRDGGFVGEAVQAKRLRVLASWAVVLFGLATAGAIAYLAGNVLVNTVTGIAASSRWIAFANDSFSLAYLVIALAGLVGAHRLVSLCDIDLETTQPSAAPVA